MVKIAIDASSARAGGGVTYLRWVIPRLAAFPDAELHGLLLPREAPDALRDIPCLFHSVIRGSRLSAATREWRSLASASDVVYTPTEVSLGFYANTPSVIAVRNARIHRDYGEGYPPLMRVRFSVYRFLARRTAGRASAVIAVSSFAGALATDVLGMDPSKVSVVPHGSHVSEPRVEGRVRLENARNLLIVSNLYRHKNIEVVLRAMVTSPSLVLRIAGAPIEEEYFRSLVKFIDDNSLGSRVRFCGHLDSAEIEDAYAWADALLWPSKWETFGHPLREAAAAGVPAIVADTSANREAAGPDAAYFDPTDDLQLSELLTRISGAPGIEVGLAPPGSSWDECAVRTWSVLRAAALDSA
jgi:glycosyltransferase involved in cell wall biosynthesis